MIDDKTLDGWAKNFDLISKEFGMPVLKRKTDELIQALRAERKELSLAKRQLLKEKQCNAVLREALELITHPTKLGEHNNPWFYRKNRAEKALAKEAEIRSEG